MVDRFNSSESAACGIGLGLARTEANYSLPVRQVTISLGHYSLLLAPGTLGGFSPMLPTRPSTRLFP